MNVLSKTNVAKSNNPIFSRFQNLLEAGRQISQVRTPDEVASNCIKYTSLLLRAPGVVLLDAENPDPNVHNVISWSLIESALIQQSPVIGLDHIGDQVIVAPIFVRGEIAYAIYAGPIEVSGTHGEEERRIIEYLATTTAAAFEKVEAFARLERHAEILEKRVDERTAEIRARSEELERSADELRNARNFLKQAYEQAEAANRVKSEFLANMSHEIRTPIAAILGFTELLIRDVIPAEQTKEKLETILGSGKHLLELVNNILDLSKIEAQEFVFEEVPMSLAEITKDVMVTLSEEASRKSIQLNLTIAPKVPASLVSDPTRIRQVLTNLIGNGIKFTESGSVDVTIGLQTQTKVGTPIEDLGPMRRIFIDVVDTGIGVDEDKINSIFDAFAQADSSTTRKYGGTGLGLSISRNIAQRLGGDISVESELGKGSRFRFEFDALVDSLESIESGTQTMKDEWLGQQPNLTKHRILIVDDARTNREFLKIVLTHAGCDVVTCDNGQQATEKVCDAPDSPFDLVLMDMQMPVMDGFTATRIIRQHDKELPIVALTAKSMKDDDKLCLAAGCSLYLSKPVSPQRLLECISSLLGTREAVKAADPEDETDNSSVNDKIAQLASKFIAGLKSKIPKFEEALIDSDFDAIKAYGHALKGSAATVGLNELARLGAKMEEAARKCCEDDVLQIIQLLRTIAEVT